jgi:hypothetical protein
MKKEILQITPCNLWNKRKRCELLIPQGYFICKSCQGIGCYHHNTSFKSGFVEIIQCGLCEGKGYVDWITNIRNSTYRRVSLTVGGFPTLSTRKRKGFKCPVSVKKCNRIKRWARNQMGAK